MFPPDFSRIQRWLLPLADTFAMSIAGTAVSVLFSLPLALFAARNTTPNVFAYHAARFVLNLLRSIPELIMGIILVAMVGFGALPGVLALGFHSIGMVGKFFAESIEHVDEKPVEAARSAGATPFQVIWHAVLPQAIPQLADTVIYRWEYNFRGIGDWTYACNRPAHRGRGPQNQTAWVLRMAARILRSGSLRFDRFHRWVWRHWPSACPASCCFRLPYSCLRHPRKARGHAVPRRDHGSV